MKTLLTHSSTGFIGNEEEPMIPIDYLPESISKQFERQFLEDDNMLMPTGFYTPKERNQELIEKTDDNFLLPNL